jgi:hypothetical protein
LAVIRQVMAHRLAGSRSDARLPDQRWMQHLRVPPPVLAVPSLSRRPVACAGSMTRRVSDRLGHYNYLVFA